MIFVLKFLSLKKTEDKQSGWCPPSDNSGRIYVNAREWASAPLESRPSYENAEHFLRFIDKYVSQAVGNHHFSQWSKANRSKTLLDRVTPSDIAYTILVYENSKEVWEEELQIKSRTNDPYERRQATRLKKPKYHEGRGKRLRRYGDGWTDSGREYYQELVHIFKTLKTSDSWQVLQDHWKLYQKNHYNKNEVNQVQECRTQEDECDESDEEDWKIDVEDEEVFGDEAVCASEDDEEEGRPRSKSRLL